jgi:hypothetical protein
MEEETNATDDEGVSDRLDESARRRIKRAYYEDRVAFETAAALLGAETATRVKLLRESLEREPPDPRPLDGGLPDQTEFYDGPIPEWTPDDRDDE